MAPGTRRATRIVHVSDLHLEPDGHEQYDGLYARLHRIRSLVGELRADVVIASGDLTNRGSSTPEHFALAAQWLDALGVPWLAVPGNHDLGANVTRGAQFPLMERYEDIPFAETGYAAALGTKLVPSAATENLTVLGVVLREDDPDGALDALRSAIENCSGPVVVVGHYPVVRTRPLTSTEPFGAQGYVDRSAGELAALLRSSPNVIAYLCGHVHVTSTAPIGDSCMQFSAGGLGPGAAALRLYAWDGMTWEYSTIDTEGPQTFWENGLEEARSNPLFSSGTEWERRGRWMPPVSPIKTKEYP
ncbi:metallophosphoesterase family protein [Microbacterium sp. YY-01]|uniref:metallophosphoesterase family protein n=1 Tax=Microbacterium sp. YY-01 TaxID=3421634 RepID=UPI003D16FD06